MEENKNNTEIKNEPEIENKETAEILYEEDAHGFSLKRDIFPKISPLSAAFIGLFGGFFVYQILGGLLTIAIFGFDVEHAPANGLRLITMAGQILFMLLPALILTKLVYEDVTNIIRAHSAALKEILMFLAGMAVLVILLQNYLYLQDYFINKLATQYNFVNSVKTIFDELNDKVEQTYLNLITPITLYDRVIIITVIAIVPAICEEVLFRGFIQRSFEFKLKPVWAAFVTAVFFGAFHVNPYAFIPLVALGFYFGFAVYKSNSILVSIILHFFNNFISILLFFMIGNEDLINSDVGSDVDLSSALSLFLFLLALFIGIVLYIRRYYSLNKNLSKNI